MNTEVNPWSTLTGGTASPAWRGPSQVVHKLTDDDGEDASAPATLKCNRCGNVLPATPEFFHRNRAMASGFHGSCKPCKKEWYDARRRRPMELQQLQSIGEAGKD